VTQTHVCYICVRRRCVCAPGQSDALTTASAHLRGRAGPSPLFLASARHKKRARGAASAGAKAAEARAALLVLPRPPQQRRGAAHTKTRACPGVSFKNSRPQAGSKQLLFGCARPKSKCFTWPTLGLGTRLGAFTSRKVESGVSCRLYQSAQGIDTEPWKKFSLGVFDSVGINFWEFDYVDFLVYWSRGFVVFYTLHPYKTVASKKVVNWVIPKKYRTAARARYPCTKPLKIEILTLDTILDT
jgi:hypothetical protein